VNRNVPSASSFVDRERGHAAVAGSVTPDFCKHIKYCCLHQNLNLNLTTKASARVTDNNEITIDRTNNRNKDKFSDNRAMIFNNQYDDMNVKNNNNSSSHNNFNAIANNNNNMSTNFSNYSDDEKSMKLTRKYSIDASINLNPQQHHHTNKSLQQSHDSFETRKCNCGKSALAKLFFNFHFYFSWLVTI
jgi:hypothetical protein